MLISKLSSLLLTHVLFSFFVITYPKQLQADTHTLILCGDLEEIPFSISPMDHLSSKIKVNDTVQRKIDHLRDWSDHVFLSTGLRESLARGSYVVTDHGSTGIRNYVVNRDFIDIFEKTKQKLKKSGHHSEKKHQEILAQANQEKVIMQLVLPQFGQFTDRYTFDQIYDCYTSGTGKMIKTYFQPRFDFSHNFNYPDLEVTEVVCQCACYQVRL